MRKIALLSMLLIMSAGCGRGWLPNLFQGAPCGGNCGVLGNPLPPPVHTTDAGCTNCGTANAYGSYDGQVIQGEYYGGGTIIDNGVITNGTVVSPPMSAIPAP